MLFFLEQIFLEVLFGAIQTALLKRGKHWSTRVHSIPVAFHFLKELFS
jgi:hypothetical protein